MADKRNLLIEAQVLGQQFVDDKDIICINETFYKYNEGVWERQKDKLVQAWICEASIQEYGPIRKNQVREIIMNIENRTYITYEKYFLSPPDRSKQINLKSGILDLETYEMADYKREDMIFHKLPFDYNPKESQDNKLKMWGKFLMSSMGWRLDNDEGVDREDFENVMNFIQEFMGYTLQPGNPHGKNLIMTGRGQNGKGTLIHVMQAMLGHHNISNVDLREINNPSLYFIMGTKDKLVNFSGDSSASQLDSSIMKSATVGEMVTGREIMKSPVEFLFSAKFIIACNEPPWVSNPDKAITRRYIILPWNHIISDEDRIVGLAEKIVANEIEAVFAWAVEGLKRLNKRGFFIPPKRADDTMKEYLKDNDNVQEWLEEDRLIDPNGRAKPKILFEAYASYCESSRYKPFGKKKFYKRLHNKQYKRVMIKGYEYFSGITSPANTPEGDQ